MNSITAHIIESSLILGIFTLFYMLTLQSSQQLFFKRWYLIASLLLGAIIPFIHISFSAGSNQIQTAATTLMILETITISANQVSETAVPIIEKTHWIIWIYLAGFGISLMRLLTGLVRIGWMKNLFSSTKTTNNRLFITSGNYNPFSFFRWIFIPESIWNNENGKIILAHEQEHSKQWHSIDILLLEMVLILQWFNPFAWIIRREIKDNHEYLADQSVLENGVKKADYLKSMLPQTVGTRFEMANNFSLSITQKRLKMMKPNKKQIHIWKPLSAIMLMLTVAFAFACQGNNDKSLSSAESQKLEGENGEQIFVVVEKMPSFPGGFDSLKRYISNTIIYPEPAKSNGISGDVLVGFSITPQGTINHVSLKQSSGNELLDKEALRVISAMPNWEPGKQRGKNVSVDYAIPVRFRNSKVQEIDGAGVVAREFKTNYKVTAKNGEKMIKGNIVDDENQPMPGVSVILASETNRYMNGTVSDKAGEFTLKLKDEHAITFSFIGYKTKRYPLNQ